MPQRRQDTKFHKGCPLAIVLRPSEIYTLRSLREMHSKPTHELVLPNLKS